MKSLLLVFAALVSATVQSQSLPLLNGQDLAGWVEEGPTAQFSVQDGALRVSGRGHVPNWIHTGREFEDFRLTFDYQLDQWAEAAVMLRAARSDRPQHTGLTIVLAHDFHHEVTPYVTGAVMGALPPLHPMAEAETWGKWHHVAIELRGTHLRVAINGVAMQDVDTSGVAALATRLRRGVIGFPDMGYGYSVRDIRIEDLGAPTKFVGLRAGDDLAGWGKRGDSGIWTAQNGVLAGAYGHSTLYAPGVFGDFELTTLVRSHDRVNSGIFLHGDADGPRRGFEIQIYSPVDAVYPTGSIYGRVRSHVSADYEERWFLLQVRLEGARCRVWIDGELVASTDALPAELLKPGRVGFQIHSDGARVEFRDMRVRPL